MIDRQTLIANLNQDLSNELQAIIMYLTYAAKVTGPLQPSLSGFFAGEVAEETAHATFLAHKIVALGGEPTTQPRLVPPASTCQEMLEAALEAERRAVQDYGQRMKEAEEYGDWGLANWLQDTVADETGHAEETERILRGWQYYFEV